MPMVLDGALADALASFEPDADEFMGKISRRIDDRLLGLIAAADYGYEADEYFTQLKKLRDEKGAFAVPMRYRPREVLALIRWSEPEDPSWKPGETGERGHWMRAFACACLLRAAGEPANGDLRQGWNSDLIQLIESLNVLEVKSLYRPAASLLAWLVQRMRGDEDSEEISFFLLGLLWLERVLV